MPVEVRVGRGNLARGLDEALQEMRVGERAEVRLEPNAAYGTHGVPTLGIPPSASLEYDIELLDVVDEPELWDMDYNTKMGQAEWRRERGVTLFKAGHAHHAYDEFLQGQRYLEYMLDLSDAEAEAVRAAKLRSELNCAASSLKLGLERETLKHCARALEYEPSNAKALYRKAQALAGLGRFDEAEATCELLSAEQPSEGEQLLKRIRARAEKLDRKQQQCYKRMFTEASGDEEREPSAGSPLAESLWGLWRARPVSQLLLALLGVALSAGVAQLVGWIVRLRRPLARSTE